MDTETARSVLYAITAIGFVVWLVGAQFVGATIRSERNASRQTMNDFGLEAAPSGRLLVGQIEVEGQPAALSAKATSALVKSGQGPLGPVKILSKTDKRLVFEGAGQNALGQPGWQLVGRGEMQFTVAGASRTAIAYAVELSSGRWLLTCALVFNALGLAALLVGFGLMLTFVLPNPNPAVRAQTAQMVQAIHFLWPPFLFVALYRQGRRAARNAFEVFVHNLPYCGEFREQRVG